ncbi:MAG: EF-hand domain-containing protein [Hyphomonadaceae bacterium]|nr:EF-hand domain-containing protein [Hyphomonadaceae bacterium]
MKLLPIVLFLSACAPAAAQSHDGSRILQQLEKADSNGDGAVSRSEFTTFRQKQFARMDRNGDGYMTESDIPRLVASRLPAGMQADQLVREFDADGDKKVSRDEFGGGPTVVFDRVDVDHDGIATKAELGAAQAALAAR